MSCLRELDIVCMQFLVNRWCASFSSTHKVASLHRSLLIEQRDARVGEACRLVLLYVRVEGRIFSVQETAEGVLELYH
jgi:hypothetical protein